MSGRPHMDRYRRVLTRSSIVVLGGVIVLSVLIGCSGDDDSSEQATTSSAPTVDDVGEVPATLPEGPPVAIEELPPVAPGESAEFEPGFILALVDIERVDIEAVGAGETSGSGVAVSLEVTNDTEAPIDLAGLTVTAVDAEGTPVVPSRGSAAEAPTGEVLPGESTVGVYVFRTPEEADGLVVTASHPAQSQVLTFTT